MARKALIVIGCFAALLLTMAALSDSSNGYRHAKKQSDITEVMSKMSQERKNSLLYIGRLFYNAGICDESDFVRKILPYLSDKLSGREGEIVQLGYDRRKREAELSTSIDRINDANCYDLGFNLRKEIDRLPAAVSSSPPPGH